MTQLTRAVQAILQDVPDSLRTLAARTGVSHTLIADLRVGKRNVTEAVARRLLGALEALQAERSADAAQYRELARSLRRALPKEGGD